ncbi:MAG: ribosome biogenesis GTPase YlqF [Candidatus Melainabacteria bacterium]|nr:ribosome biogenesis GTPase YlqF [Candidatus Melainabacteria bacterium]
MTIQWYPGHIAKWDRQLDTQLKLVDVVILVIDSRVPVATINQDLFQRVQQKPVLLLLNKSSLADPAQSTQWLKHYQQEGYTALLYDAHQQPPRQGLIRVLAQLGEPQQKKLLAKGLKRRAIRVMVVGMPNVGKSSLINSIVGRKKTITGHKAGVTRASQWVRIHPQVELLDSPGVIPPKLSGQETGALLAVVSSVGDGAYDEQAVAGFLLARLFQLYPKAIEAAYCIDSLPAIAPSDMAVVGFVEPLEAAFDPSNAPKEMLTADRLALIGSRMLLKVAEHRGYRLSPTAWDVSRAARAVLKDFRQGRLGRMTLEPCVSPTEVPGTALAELEEPPAVLTIEARSDVSL